LNSVSHLINSIVNSETGKTEFKLILIFGPILFFSATNAFNVSVVRNYDSLFGVTNQLKYNLVNEVPCRKLSGFSLK